METAYQKVKVNNELVSGEGPGEQGEDRKGSAEVQGILFCKMGEAKIFFE